MTRKEAEEEEKSGSQIFGGGHGRGRGQAGRAVSSSSNAKKTRSMEELMGVGDLLISSMGGLGKLVVGNGQVQLNPPLSSPLPFSLYGVGSMVVAGMEMFVNVEEGGVEEVDDKEDEEESVGFGGGRVGKGKLLIGTEQGRSLMLGLQPVEVLYTCLSSGAEVEVQRRGVGWVGRANGRQSEHSDEAAKASAHAHHLFDGTSHRKGAARRGIVARPENMGEDGSGELGVEGTGWLKTTLDRGRCVGPGVGRRGQWDGTGNDEG